MTIRAVRQIAYAKTGGWSRCGMDGLVLRLERCQAELGPALPRGPEKPCAGKTGTWSCLLRLLGMGFGAARLDQGGIDAGQRTRCILRLWLAADDGFDAIDIHTRTLLGLALDEAGTFTGFFDLCTGTGALGGWGRRSGCLGECASGCGNKNSRSGDLDKSFHQGFLVEIDKVTAEDVATVAKELLSQPQTLTVVGPYEADRVFPRGANG